MTIELERLKQLLDISSRDHNHLCPRQILGVRIGLMGMSVLGFEIGQRHKALLVIAETDGCFIDGVIAATQCTVGHRTLRVEDYGKVAATFVNTQTGRAVRILPALDVREKANQYAPAETRHYFAQLQAYQVMPDAELLNVQAVNLTIPVNQIISHPSQRVTCENCGEEVLNGRGILVAGKQYCHFCAMGGYYQVAKAENDQVFSS